MKTIFHRSVAAFALLLSSSIGNAGGGGTALVSPIEVKTCSGQFVRTIAVTGLVTCQAVDLAADVSGTLPFGNGGTGATALTQHGAVVAGASALSTIAPGTSGNVLTSNGTDWTSTAASGGAPAGSPGDIQYNNTGVFGGRAPSGNGTSVVTTTGSQTNGDCVKIDSNGNHVANGGACGGGSVSALASQPQGRLTLTSGVPVMIADATAQTTIYYDCYQGNLVPVGAVLTNLTIGSCQVSMGLDAGVPHVASGSVYDIFAVNSSGTLVICVGPAWTSTAARGTGAGTTQIDQNNGGIWTNTVSITNCWGGASGTTDRGVVAAGAGTYLGSVNATANGQSGMQFRPTAASGGSNNVLGLYNAYNRVRTPSVERDNNGSWTNATTSLRSADNNNNTRVTYLDGLAQSFVTANYSVTAQANTNNMTAVGIGCSSTTVASHLSLGDYDNATVAGILSVTDTCPPALGLKFIQALEVVGGGTLTFYGSLILSLSNAVLHVSLDM